MEDYPSLTRFWHGSRDKFERVTDGVFNLRNDSPEKKPHAKLYKYSRVILLLRMSLKLKS